MNKVDLFSTNPLFLGLDGPGGDLLPAYDLIQPHHFKQAFRYAIADLRRKARTISHSKTQPGFVNTVQALEHATGLFNHFEEIFHHLLTVRRTPEMEEIEKWLIEREQDLWNGIYLDPALYRRISRVYKSRSKLCGNEEEIALTESIYNLFQRNGAGLPADRKARLPEIDKSIKQLSAEYDTMMMDSSDKTFLVITDKAELDGLPETLVRTAAVNAKAADLPGQWLFYNDLSTWFSFMSAARNREARRRYYEIPFQSERAVSLVKKILNLRYERARILGYQSHTEFQLDDRMVGSKKDLTDFLNRIKHHVSEAEKSDRMAIRRLAAKDGIRKTKNHDTYYYEERLREKSLGFDPQKLRRYFRFENSLSGCLAHLHALYHLRFEANTQIPTWHPDVRAFDVYDDKTGTKAGTLLIDPFARRQKEGGAECRNIVTGGMLAGRERLPVVAVTCDIAQAPDGEPSLLSLEDNDNIFHELGHAAHAFLARSRFRHLSSGNNVKWDFIEFPSLINQNWAAQPEVLDLYARDYETGEKIPEDVKEKIGGIKKFMAGSWLRYFLEMTYLDLSLHSRNLKNVNLWKYEPKVLARHFPGYSADWSLTATFQHVATCGYDAGYYSYLWSEALDADAFTLFRQNGLYHPETAGRLRGVIEKAAIVHPGILFQDLCGHAPDPGPLLRRYGLLPENDNAPAGKILAPRP